MVQLFEGARRKWRSVLAFSAASLVFWLLQFTYQFYFLFPDNWAAAYIASFAFAGATYITLALLCSALFRWKPVWNKYWPLRRNLGVVGVLFVFLHVQSVILFTFGGNLFQIFYSLNPLENMLLLGFIAYLILIPIALVSSDWALSKLKFARWKAIQQWVHVAYLATVFHFLVINPAALNNLAGYGLIGLTGITLLSELYWFLRLSARAQFKNREFKWGLVLIALYLVLAYLIFL